MKSAINTFALLASTSLFGAVVQATCHADKYALLLHSSSLNAYNIFSCYRALFPCASPAAVSSALDFCHTLTAGTALTTTIPTRATSACGTDPAHYSSACSCGPSCPTSIITSTTNPACPTPTIGVVPNGDFECGITSWTPQVPDSAATWKISSPGATGTNAFEADLLSAPATPELGVSVRVTSAAVAVTPGVPYVLAFNSWFDDLLSGFIGVMVNDSPIYTVDATDKGAGSWQLNEVPYTPTTSTVTLRFEFLFGTQHEPRVQKIDTVVLRPA